MSLIQQEQLNFTELKALVYCTELNNLALFKKVLSSVGIKKVQLLNSIDALLANNSSQTADIILLDVAEHEATTASDWVDQLVYSQQLTPKQLLLLCSGEAIHAHIRLDYPYHQVAFVPHPLNHALIEQQLRQFSLYQPVVKAIQSLALLQRYSDALKVVLFQKQKQQHPEMQLYLERLQVQILLDSHQLEHAKDLLKPALQQQKQWALWANFRLMYEQQSPANCLAYLQKPAHALQHFPERRDSYQLYLLLLLGQNDDAWQLASRIPLGQLTPRLLRLSHLIAVVTGRVDEAQQLLDKKRRWFSKGKNKLICDLMEMRALLYQHHQQHFAGITSQLDVQRLMQLLQESQQDKAAALFHIEFQLIAADLQVINGDPSSTLDCLHQLTQHKNHPLMLQIWCHAAILAALLARKELCVQFLWRAHQSAYNMVDCSQRIHGLCMLQQTFALIPAAQRPLDPLVELAIEQADVWGAAELIYLCVPPHERQQELSALLIPLGFNQFHGVQLHPSR